MYMYIQVSQKVCTYTLYVYYKHTQKIFTNALTHTHTQNYATPYTCNYPDFLKRRFMSSLLPLNSELQKQNEFNGFCVPSYNVHVIF